MARVYLAPATINGRAYLAPDIAPVVTAPPDSGMVDISKIHPSRIVVFEGSGSRITPFEGSGSKITRFE